MVFYNLILKVTSHTYCHILFITNKSLSPAHTQDRGITQGHQCQEVITGDHLKKLPIYLSCEFIFSINNAYNTIFPLAQTRNTRLALYSFTSPLTPVNPSRCFAISILPPKYLSRSYSQEVHYSYCHYLG